jgi:hypothetical protein
MRQNRFTLEIPASPGTRDDGNITLQNASKANSLREHPTPSRPANFHP